MRSHHASPAIAERRLSPANNGNVVIALKTPDDDGNELPTGQAGLVYFELPETPFRYLNDDEKTEDALHPQYSNWSTLGDVLVGITNVDE